MTMKKSRNRKHMKIDQSNQVVTNSEVWVRSFLRVPVSKARVLTTRCVIDAGPRVLGI